MTLEVQGGEVSPAPVAAETAPAPVETPTTEVQQTEAEAKPERTFTQKELDDIVQRRLAKEGKRAERIAYERARREAAEAELERLRQAQSPQPQAWTPAQGKPDPKQFSSYEDYVEALSDWKLEQRLTGLRESSDRAMREQEAVKHAQTIQAKLTPAAQKYADFADVALDETLPIAPPTAAFIGESELGGDIAYYLGKNRDEAEKIAAMSPAAQYRELVKIEQKLTAPPKPTKAPAPIEPTVGKTQVEKDPNEMSYDEFVKWRKSQIKRRRGVD